MTAPSPPSAVVTRAALLGGVLGFVVGLGYGLTVHAPTA